MAKGSTIVGQETLAKNIVKYTDGFLREVNIDMRKVEIKLKKRIKKNISHTDHSLRDLAKMGHPYALRQPVAVHKPSYSVHRQSGEMLQGLQSGTESASVKSGKLKAAAYAGIDDGVEHAKYVVYGTSKMIPRDFLRGSLNEESEEIQDLLKRSLHNVTVNFNGKKVKL